VFRRSKGPRIDPSSVSLHYGDIAVPYEVIVELTVPCGLNLSLCERRMRKDAAKMGANAVIRLQHTYHSRGDASRGDNYRLKGTAVRLLGVQDQ
jgi:hypothetical protein